MRQSFLPLFDWYAHTSLARTMSESATLIALAQIVHLLGMTLFLGTILMVDLTLLGFGIKHHPAARVGEELAPYTAAGFGIMVVTGLLNISSEAMKCYDSTFFWTKMGLLLLAFGFYFWVHQRVVRADPPVSRWGAGLVACVSLALWLGVALAAKFIAIYGDDLRQRTGLPHPTHLAAVALGASLLVSR